MARSDLLRRASFSRGNGPLHEPLRSHLERRRHATRAAQGGGGGAVRERKGAAAGERKGSAPDATPDGGDAAAAASSRPPSGPVGAHCPRQPWLHRSTESFDYIEPVSFTQENTEVLQCWVWMWNPDQLPRSKLTTLFQEGAGPSRPAVPAAPPNGDMVNLIIHLDRYFDWTPLPASRTPSSRASGLPSSSSSESDGRPFPFYKEFIWYRGSWTVGCLRLELPGFTTPAGGCLLSAGIGTPTRTIAVGLARRMIFPVGIMASPIGTAPARRHTMGGDTMQWGADSRDAVPTAPLSTTRQWAWWNSWAKRGPAWWTT
uniref:Uncharacterized protein n=1 Tax=Setaria viridis TaxID=4556 RepID=A0A4U6TDG1_SETVI|nr:hypothetical protein SEVIR_9G572400v2 [Setaria viridis]